MQKSSRQSWYRMSLAFIAVLTIAGTGLVFASGPKAGYPAPKTAVIEGPNPARVGQGNAYSLFVTFVDGSTATFTTQATWSLSAGTGGGSFSANVYTPASAGRELLAGSFTSSGVSVSANRVVTTQ